MSIWYLPLGMGWDHSDWWDIPWHQKFDARNRDNLLPTELSDLSFRSDILVEFLGRCQSLLFGLVGLIWVLVVLRLVLKKSETNLLIGYLFVLFIRYVKSDVAKTVVTNHGEFTTSEKSYLRLFSSSRLSSTVTTSLWVSLQLELAILLYGIEKTSWSL